MYVNNKIIIKRVEDNGVDNIGSWVIGEHNVDIKDSAREELSI